MVVEIRIVLVFMILYDLISHYYDGISVETVEMINVKGVVLEVVVVVVALSNHDSTSVDAPFGGAELLLRRAIC